MAAPRAFRLLAVLAALGTASCSGVSLPEQGFATRYLGGSFGPTLREEFDTSVDFAGHPMPDSTAARPTPPRDTCEATARGRAGDIATEGYDETLQKKVYDAVLADCRSWSKRR